MYRDTELAFLQINISDMTFAEWALPWAHSANEANLAEVHLCFSKLCAPSLKGLSRAIRRVDGVTISVPQGHEADIPARLRHLSTIRVLPRLEDMRKVLSQNYQLEVSCTVADMTELLPNLKGHLSRVLFDLGMDDSELADLYLDDRIQSNDCIRIRGQVMTRELLRAHPCNAFVSTQARCHGAKTSFPRELVLGADALLRPYGLPDDDLIIGCATDAPLCDLLAAYEGSPAHEKFLKLNRRAYLDHVVSGVFIARSWRGVLSSYAHEHAGAQ